MSFYLHLSGTFIFQSQWPQLFPTQFFSFKTKQNILQIDKWIQLKCRILKIFLHKNISLKKQTLPTVCFKNGFYEIIDKDKFEISLRIVLCQGAKHGTNQCVTFQHWTWRTRNFIVINNQIWWSSLTKNFDLQTNVGCPCLICTLIGQFDIFDA